ncbi:hypothetical protein NSU_3319 [Novosphingobium pentaromativorans US6-1]|uniref:Uncharacterized protein n=1 Tax=Novosphingobium pentaromativorans US6-1 TaxID=1088721 RepID=G6EG48_9SPHN|nr:hypothetical protein NSU_3319 [Novosphingobium pentaromativorans US6-1]
MIIASSILLRRARIDHAGAIIRESLDIATIDPVVRSCWS